LKRRKEEKKMEIPKLKKLYCLVPESLFERIKNSGKFNHGFDAWVSKVLDEALRKEEGQ